MGTKEKPGLYDCLAGLKEDEPYFVLVAHDASASGLVRQWARKREHLINVGEKPEEDRAQVSEAMECADLMDAWRCANKLPINPGVK